MKKRLFVIVLLINTTIFLCAQQPDERIGNLISQAKWFELQREYAIYKDSLSPFIHDFASSLLSYYFNEPDAPEKLGNMMNKHGQMLDYHSQLSCGYFIHTSYARMGQNGSAAAVLSSIMKQLEGHLDEKTQLEYTDMLKSYQTLANEGDILQVQRPEKDIIIPITVDSVGKYGQKAIHLNGCINGNPQQFQLDTGAGHSVVSPEMAKRCKMRIIRDSIKVSGLKTGYGQLAIADTFSIGEMTFHKVPFLVLNMKTNNAAADSFMNSLRSLIGADLLARLEEVEINFDSLQIKIPQRATPNPLKYSNLRFNNEYLWTIEVTSGTENLSMHFDCGAGGSSLTGKYFNNHKEMIQQTGKQDTIRVAGFGGIMRKDIYKLPGFCISVGPVEGCIPEIYAYIDSDLPFFITNEDGWFGMDLFYSYGSITINLKDMYVKTTPKKRSDG
ncbi:retropepsin-like aspartic protease [Bacteroides sp.]|uniref:retropepsin-like aspartic protease n=1 Tax=Bacteroides sp. TaxID=29523 RepID=UPI002625C8E5|nr:retropepsin-like aspartic protease [Bacteroides sp.]MDD3036296.1 retropepsin-like aspartic protease [Bacteroides sp.]